MADPDEPKYEKLCAKFKTEDNVKQFKTEMDKIYNELNSDTTSNIIAEANETNKEIENLKEKINKTTTEIPNPLNLASLTKKPLARKESIPPTFGSSMFSKNSSSISTKPFSFKSQSENDVQFISTLLPTLDEKSKCDKLMLPNNFYFYEREIYLSRRSKLSEQENERELNKEDEMMEKLNQVIEKNFKNVVKY